LLLLLLLYLACLGDPWPEPAWDTFWSSFLTCSAVLIVALAACVVAQRTQRRLRRDPQARETIVRRYSRFRFYHLMALFLVYGLALYLLGWGWAVKEACTIDRPDFLPTIANDGGLLLPGAELVLLAPLLVSLVLSWVCFYDAERALYYSAHPLTGLRPF